MRVLGLTCCLLLSLVTSPLLAQSDTQAAKAAIVFDMRMEKVTGSPLGQSLDLKGKLAQVPKSDGPDMTKIVRIFGASTAPKDMNEMQQMQNGGLPVDFFVRFEFTDSEAAAEMIQRAKDNNSGTMERNGVTYYKAPEGDAPEGVMMYSPSEKTVEIGTEAFAFRTSDKPFTDVANSAWGSIADEAIRVAVDMTSAPDLIEQLVAEGKKNGPAMAGAYLDLLKNMNSMTLSVDLAGKNLATMQAVAKSDSAATEIKEAADSLLAMAREGGKMQAKQVEQMNPDGAKVMVKLLDGLNAGAQGDKVVVNVPKPEGFDDAMTKIVNQMAQMFGMGPGMNDNF